MMIRLAASSSRQWDCERVRCSWCGASAGKPELHPPSAFDTDNLAAWRYGRSTSHVTTKAFDVTATVNRPSDSEVAPWVRFDEGVQHFVNQPGTGSARDSRRAEGKVAHSFPRSGGDARAGHVRCLTIAAGSGQRSAEPDQANHDGESQDANSQASDLGAHAVANSTGCRSPSQENGVEPHDAPFEGQRSSIGESAASLTLA